MKKKKLNKKSIILIVSIIVVVILAFVVTSLLPKKEELVTIESYDKYMTTVSIDLSLGDNKNEMTMFNTYNDGKVVQITTGDILMESYIIGNKLYYLQDKTFYTYVTDISYKDLYDELSSIKDLDVKRSDENSTVYTSLLDKDKTNKILECLFFKKKTSQDNIINITLTDGKISEARMTIFDLDGYKEANIILQFKELDSEYRINTSKLNGTVLGSPLDKVSFEDTDKNIFEVAK